ncbi:alpha-glucoside transport system permease protein [Nocardia transvalensis]|uniref:Alpha-glucoside transport system permease protein n=1 Tax=Nocardia transvalensis TaxID=37333 RepID=A0A7W9PI39_9NOCA|nr:hypothetical protein [Nocardia transvalensis]MBB5916300.1 alpha-glucoside transport system permease protein [Nocardia transvalensis]
MAPERLYANGLELELATRRMAGPLIAGSHPRRWVSWVLQLPAAALVLLLLVGPAATTVWTAARVRPGMVVCCAVFAAAAVLLRMTFRKDARLAALWNTWRGSRSGDAEAPHPFARWVARIGRIRGPLAEFLLLRNRTRAAALWTVLLVVSVTALVISAWGIAVALGAEGRGAYGRTLLWVLCALGILGAALEFARIGRRAWWPWQPLILPFGMSAFAGGLALRLVFEYPQRRLPLDSVTGQQMWLFGLLFAVFVWAWLGVLFTLFRAAVDAVEADPVRRDYAYHRETRPARTELRVPWTGPRVRAFLSARARTHAARRAARPSRRRLFELVRPVFLVLGLVVAVAAARVFDAILIAVPGSLQYSLDSATVHWWRLVTDDGLDRGVAAAYALPLAVLVGLAAYVLQTNVRRHQTGWAARPAREPVPPRLAPPGLTGRRRISATTRGLLRVLAVSLLAVWPIVVLAVFGLIGADGPGLAGPDAVWRDSEMLRAMANTGWVALWATLLLLCAALPVAHYLAALRSDSAVSKVAVVFLVVFTVMPAQMYVGPIRRVIELFGLTGTSVSSLIVVHAAIGLPIAVLILRGALLAPLDSPAADALHGLAGPGAVVWRVLVAARTALGAVAVLELIQVWNDFFIGLLVSGSDVSPWSLLLWGEARQFNENASHLAAGALLAAVPPTLLLLATWRRFLVPGLTGGVLR